MKSFVRKAWAARLLGGMLVGCLSLSAAEGDSARGKRSRAGARADAGVGAGQGLMNRATDKLGLSEEQKTKLDELTRKSREELEQKVKESNLLTEEQFAKWKELQGNRFSGGGASAGAALRSPLSKIPEELGLSEEQKTKLTELMRDQYRQMGALRGQADKTPGNRMEQFKKLREELEQKVKESNILTDEQFAKWKELQGQGFSGASRRGKK